MNGTHEEKRTSPWVYVALGCSIPLLLIVILFGATAFWGWKLKKHIVDDTPDMRAERVKQVLGCREVPEGYHAMLTVSVPFLMDLAILSDRPPDFKDKKRDPFDKQGFIYINAIRGKKGKSLRDYIEGKEDASDFFDQGNVRMGDREEIGRGSFPLEGATAYYVTNRGSLSAEGKAMRGLVSLIYFECPGDKRFRVGIWFGPDPRAGQPLGTPADYAGTHADEAEIREFVSPFAPCAH